VFIVFSSHLFSEISSLLYISLHYSCTSFSWLSIVYYHSRLFLSILSSLSPSSLFLFFICLMFFHLYHLSCVIFSFLILAQCFPLILLLFVFLSCTFSRIQSWNFKTFYGGWEPSRNRVIVLARHARGGGIDALESIPGLLKSLKIRALFSPSHCCNCSERRCGTWRTC
jgi:hypothetical protein